MSAAHIFNLFIAASVAGWVYECIYCTVKTTHWQNRGFLFGPVCPIYGFGFIGAFFLFTSGKLQGAGGQVSLPLLFVICAAGSAVLEYSTSFLLEKLFHARWWDYSHIPLNLNGRICLPATLGFGAAGVVIIGYVLPLIDSHAAFLRSGLEPAAEELISLAFMCVLGVDLGLSISSVTSLLGTLERMGTEFDEVMGTRYEPIGRAQRALAGKIGTAGTVVADRISDAGHMAAGKISDAGHSVAGKISGAGHSMVGMISDAGNAVVDKISDAGNVVVDKISDAGNAVVDKISDAGNAVVDKISDAGHAVAGKIESAGDYQDALRRQVGSLSHRQINTLMNIEVFSSIRHTGIAKKMKEMLPGQAGENDTPENGSKTELPENGGKTGMAENVGKTGMPENGSKTELPENVSKTGMPENGGKTELPENVGKTGMPENGGKTELPENGGKSDISGNEGKTDTPYNIR